MSARARIVGWVLLLVVAALVGSLFVTAEVLNLRVDDLANDRLTHAAESFRTFATSPSGRSQQSTDALLTRYLEDTVPNRAETSFSLLAGHPHRRTAGDPTVRLDQDAPFIASIAGMTTPTYGRMETTAGTVEYAVIPVEVVGDPVEGSLVVVLFRDELAAPLFESLKVFAGVALIAVLFAGVVGWLVAGRVLEPVRLVRQTAEQISESDLRRRIPVSGSDDIAQLAITFNRMLDRLESAFATQRQFLDDAGHELRTPITVIRGHLELLGGHPEAIADPEHPATSQPVLIEAGPEHSAPAALDEWRETTALVADELDRMTRIVDELLVLARSEQPDFLIIKEVDLADLTVDALANARMLAPRRWIVDSLAEGRIAADGQRLTQALMQMATNAVQHTGGNDTIAIGSRIADDRLLLWIRDTGTGVAPHEREQIFERFRRGTGARRGAGAGLGLSIVRSIAHAHGGTVGVESKPGEGATFTLNLPLRAGDDERADERADEHETREIS